MLILWRPRLRPHDSPQSASVERRMVMIMGREGCEVVIEMLVLFPLFSVVIENLKP